VVLCRWRLTNTHQPKAKPVFSFGMTSVFDLWYKQWTFYYKFSCGCGMTEANIPTAQSPGR